MTLHTATAFVQGSLAYPTAPPFHPASLHPEYSMGPTCAVTNQAYHAVRECFALSELDAPNLDTPEWNPLSKLINPGETVVLKPNFVKECHPRDPNGWTCVLTHGSIVRAVADYVWKAVGPRGKVIVADAPQTDSSFDKICRLLGLYEVRDFYRRLGLNFDLLDLRKEEWVNRDGVIVERRSLAGDPKGYCAFDLGDASEFRGHPGVGRYYGADYDTREVNRHHGGGRHEYLVSRTLIEADVIFNLPKLKTHKKSGITGALKNLVGINGDKNWLPHHTEGDPSMGGDEHPDPGLRHRVERRMVEYFRRVSLGLPYLGPWLHRHARTAGSHVFGGTEDVIRSGNWWGNDTVWRMCLDLNKILLYGNPDGTLRAPLPANRKRHYVLVDGILAGEGRGPMNPDPVPAGLVVFGLHPASVDAACALLMGFDPERIPLVRQAFRCASHPLADWAWHDVGLLSNKPHWNGRLPSIPHEFTLHFEPHFGWKGHIEREPAALASA